MSCHLVTNAGSVDPACVAFVPGQFGRTQGVWRKRRRPHCCRTNGENPHYLIETFISLTYIHTSKALTRAYTPVQGPLTIGQCFHTTICVRAAAIVLGKRGRLWSGLQPSQPRGLDLIQGVAGGGGDMKGLSALRLRLSAVSCWTRSQR